MSFAPRVVPKRADILEIYGPNPAQNILEKSAVSNMVGMLQQLNEISKYASEIFASILQDADKNMERVQSCKKRLSTIEQRVPKVEEMFIQNSPAYFYDNPYTGREYARRDPLRGGFFRRDRSSYEINRRRNEAQGPPDLSVMNEFSEKPCLKKYSDPDFFVTQWLDAQTKKMEEEKKKRKQRKMEKMKEKELREMKRTETQKILKVQKPKYNDLGQRIDGDAKEEYVDARQYKIEGAGNFNIPQDDKHQSPPRKSNDISEASNQPPEPSAQQGGPPPIPRPGPPQQQQQQQPPPPVVLGPGGKPLPPMVVASMIASGALEPQSASGAKPPPSPAYVVDDEPGGNSGQSNYQQAQPYASTYAQESFQEYEQPSQPPPPTRPKPQLPVRSANFIAEIQGGASLKKMEPIQRVKTLDARSGLLDQIKKEKNLRKVEPVEKKKEDKAEGGIYAILQRREMMVGDSSDEEEESDWGSDAD